MMSRILRSRLVLQTLLASLSGLPLIACSTFAQVIPPVGRAGRGADTLDPNLVPVGFGKLRQDDITLRFTLTGGLQIRAIPLDERIIRVLSPDSYQVMSQLRESQKRAVDSIADRTRLQSYSLWFVTFYGVEQGEARFSPREFIIQNVGHDFRPIDVLPLTTGFGEYRVKQREKQSALYVFDGQLDINQPLTARVESTETSTDWLGVLQRVEQERNAVRSRASSTTKPPPGAPQLH